MACEICGEPASSYIETKAGKRCVCRFCSEVWWSIQLQPPSNDFWEGERERHDENCAAASE